MTFKYQKIETTTKKKLINKRPVVNIPSCKKNSLGLPAPFAIK